MAHGCFISPASSAGWGSTLPRLEPPFSSPPPCFYQPGLAKRGRSKTCVCLEDGSELHVVMDSVRDKRGWGMLVGVSQSPTSLQWSWVLGHSWTSKPLRMVAAWGIHLMVVPLGGQGGMMWRWQVPGYIQMAALITNLGSAVCLSLLPSQAGNVEFPNWGTTMLWGIMSCLILVMLLIIQFINLELKKKLKKTPVRGSKKQTSFHNTGPG